MIHQYKNNGYNIVLDVYSGAVHVVDDLCYDVIAVLNEPDEEPTAEILKSDLTWENLKKRLGDTYSEEDLRDALDDVIELTEDGKLFTKDEFEYLVPIVKKRKTVVKALCLHIAHDCNLACRYCFAEEGEYHGRRALMSYEVGKKALDFLIANSGSRRNLEVDFFGGEPLMNWQVVKDLVAYGREQEKLHDKNFRFTVTTNGVLLNDEIQEFVNKEMDNVVISLDGRKEINDKMRPFRNGKGSYDLIVPKFQKLAESRNQEKYYIRGTFTRNNLDFSNDILHFADLGFKQMSIEPVVGDESDPYAIREEDIPQIKEEYDKLTPYEQINIKRSIINMAVFATMMAIGRALMGYREDNEDSWFGQFITYIGFRTINEIASQTSPFMELNAIDMLQDPLVTARKLGDLTDPRNWDPFATVQTGVYKGESKLWRQLMKFSFGKQWYNIKTARDIKQTSDYWLMTNGMTMGFFLGGRDKDESGEDANWYFDRGR